MAGRKATMASAVAVALLLVLAMAGTAAAGFTLCRVDVERVKGSCQSYCTRGSRAARPSSQCCGSLRGADFPCLCQYRSLLALVPYIDAGSAMQIPTKCGIRGAPRSC